MMSAMDAVADGETGLAGSVAETVTATADVIVVGAGPGGSATAAYLAMAGLDVLLLEKTTFPREKVCGDGLTPRAVRELITLGIPHPEEDGWVRNHGLRIIGGGHAPQAGLARHSEFPPYGLVRTRMDFDEILARHAVKHGARLLEATNVTGPVLDDAGAIVGVRAQRRRRRRPQRRAACSTYRAPLVVAADGNSVAAVACRWAARSATTGRWASRCAPTTRARGTTTTSWSPGSSCGSTTSRTPASDPAARLRLDLRRRRRHLQRGPRASSTPPRRSATSTTRTSCGAGSTTMPAEWTFNDETMVGPIRGAALPMGFNRQPHYADGLLLVGDAGGMVNPFNGEGIAYAMESGRLAAEVDRAGVRAPRPTPAASGSLRPTPA